MGGTSTIFPMSQDFGFIAVYILSKPTGIGPVGNSGTLFYISPIIWRDVFNSFRTDGFI